MKSKFKSLILFFIFNISYCQINNQLKVIIDPFHGGKDFGFNDIKSKTMEKDINLLIASKVIKLLNNKPNIEIVEIRNSDDFIPLNDKIYLANTEATNLYIAINCLSNNDTKLSGASIFILNKSDNSDALNYAIEENKVVKKTKNYKNLYPEFNEFYPDSLVYATKYDKKYLDLSNNLANVLDSEFKTNSIKSNGILNGPFFLLHQVFMPSAIVNLGYLSNEQDKENLLSNDGQDKIALSIANAIIGFKNKLDNNSIDLNKILGKSRDVVSILNDEKSNINKNNTINKDIESDKTAKDKILAEKQETDRLAKAKIEADKTVKDKILAEKQETDRLAKAKIEADKTAKDKILAEKQETDRLAKLKIEADKYQKENQIAEKKQAELLAKAKIEGDKKEKEKQIASKNNIQNNEELNNLLLQIEKSKVELANIKSEISDANKELENVINNIEIAKNDFKKEQVKIENAKSYLIKLNNEILTKINEVEKSRSSINNSSNIQNNDTSSNTSDISYINSNLTNEVDKTYRIQVFACVICSKIPKKYVRQSNYKEISKIREEGLNKFFIFETTNKEIAYQELAKVREIGYSDAFMTCYIGTNKVKIE
jgi:N-acetylmuramoyl-L-alanine amidase